MIVLLILGAYLLGSIPVGVLVGRAFGFDPRATGSHNIGMTNVARAGGKTAAAITFAGDLLKGLIPVAAIRVQGYPPAVLAMVGFAAFAGSIASIFLLFKGGRGVSTSVGVWLGLAPLPIGISSLVFLVMLTATRIVSLASISAAIALVPAVAARGCPRPYLLLAILMSALVLLRHHENIRRLINGEEPTIGSSRVRATQGKP
jgi:acyl phosphate:glycerol-3-phosphate acyltransferase